MKYITDESMSIKDFLRRKVGISAKMLSALKRDETGIMKNGVRATVTEFIGRGDILEINEFCSGKTDDKNLFSESRSHMPENNSSSSVLLDIIYEDSHILSVNKPPYMPTHQSYLHRGDTLSDIVMAYMKKQNPSYIFRAVNRLDKDTSGIVLTAKDRITSSLLAKSMQNKEIEKSYIAVLSGCPDVSEGEIKTYIRRREESIITREVCGENEGGEFAVTHYKILFRHDNECIVCARPVSGRTHQLRVHFSHIGCPIVGDTLYGIADTRIDRQALHAYRLSFTHPHTRERVILSAPLPDDMRKLITDMGFDCSAIMNLIL